MMVGIGTNRCVYGMGSYQDLVERSGCYHCACTNNKNMEGHSRRGGLSPRRWIVTPVTNRIEMVAVDHVETRRPGKKCVT